MCNKIQKLSDYFLNNFSNKKEGFNIISSYTEGQEKKCFVDNEEKVYNFDEIVKSVLCENKGYSVDAVQFLKERIVLIEFKTGFKDKLDLREFIFNDETNCIKNPRDLEHCERLGEYFFSYYDKHFEKRMKEKEYLIDILALKLIESIKFLEGCINGEKLDDVDILYLVVTDSYYLCNKNYSIIKIDCDILKKNNWQYSKCGNAGSVICTPKENILIQTRLDKLTRPYKNFCKKVKVVLGEEFTKEWQMLISK